MKIIRCFLLFCFSCLSIQILAQDIDHYQKYIPELITTTFSEPVENATLDDRGNLEILFENQLELSFNLLDIETMVIESIKNEPSIRFDCRDNFYCLNRKVNGKPKKWKYSYFNIKFDSLTDAENILKAFKTYKKLIK